MTKFIRIQESSNLPEEWNLLADNYFQQKKFLSHTEKYNPCQQRYYLLFENEKIISGAIVYSLRLDIFTFTTLKSPIEMNIVGVPCSVSSPGIFGKSDAIESLKKHIYDVEKGFVLVLNLKDNPIANSNASGSTLPTIVFFNEYQDWNNYVASLRSSYRRRLRQINRKNPDLRIEKKSCSDFTREMHRQYLEVYKRSSGKLEKLSFDFFKNLPPEFNLSVCYQNDSIIGWNIALEYQDIYYFFLGGVDYKKNSLHNTYLRLMTSLIKDGIEKKATFIELGQTAEIPKMRMGGKPEFRYMEARHSRRLLNKILKSSSSLLEYKVKLENPNALKKENP